MAEERKGVITLKGSPMTLAGPELSVGDKAPAFQVITGDLSGWTLGDWKGKIKILCSVPSLDTPVCAEETKRFNQEAAILPEQVAIAVISCDLPFAQARFCGTVNIDKVKTLSDHKDVSFGLNWGVLIQELRILARAVFVVDQNDVIRYVEIVKEVANYPNYDKALQSVHGLLKGTTASAAT
jgi:thioredoxin-dependent peroxiredoxin